MKNIPPTRPLINSSGASSSEEFSSFSEDFSSFSEDFSSSSESKQDPKLELAVIYGPDQLQSEADFLHFMDKKSGLIHAMEGFNDKKIEVEKIKNLVTDRLKTNANLFLIGHGFQQNNAHHLALLDDSFIVTKDLIDLTFNKSTISDQDNTASKPIIHIVSCEAGTLKNEIRPGSHSWKKGYVILYSSRDTINYESTSNSIEAVMRHLQECKSSNRTAKPLELFLHAVRSQGSQITILGGDLHAPITSNFPRTPSEQNDRDILSCLKGDPNDISRLSKIQEEAGLKNKLTRTEKKYQARLMLFNALEDGNVMDVMEILEKYPNTVNLIDYRWRTPLHVCATHTKTLIAYQLISKGAKLDVKDMYGNTPLHNAFILSNDDLAEILIEKEANFCMPNNNGDTALHLAIESGKLSLVKEMLQHKNKLKLDICDEEGNTPLMLAAMKGYLNTVKMLLNEKADTTIRNKNGENAYSLAVNTKHARTAELISQHAKRQNIQSKEKEILKQPTKKN